MENISNNITYREATRSNTAIKRGIDNTPNEVQLACMKKVAEKCFEPVREWYNNPISINSFFRSPKLNKAIGGSYTSQHCQGEAIDMDADEDNHKLFDWLIENVEFDQIIWEYGTDENPDWIHISYESSRPNRNEILKVEKVDGTTKYSHFTR